MKVLVTGYGPFLSHSLNPSQLVAETLDSRIIKSLMGDLQIESIVCPVNSEGAGRIEQKLESKDWKMVIHLGLDASADKIYIETCAFNSRAQLRGVDHSGNVVEDTKRRGDIAHSDPIDACSPVLLPSTFPLSSSNLNALVLGRVKDESTNLCTVIASWSRDPGTFYCNEQYFKTLNLVRKLEIKSVFHKDSLLPVLFIHIPKLNDIYTVDNMAEFIIELIQCSIQ